MAPTPVIQSADPSANSATPELLQLLSSSP
jgi:hypothetical protein